MTKNFLEFLISLAPEGETPLIVRQKPILRDGELQLHADGAVKCTWPAFLLGLMLFSLGVQVIGFGLVGEIIIYYTQTRNLREYRIGQRFDEETPDEPGRDD